MTELIGKSILFYAVAGCIIGIVIASYQKVEASFLGRQLPYPRVSTFIIASVLWPAVLFQMLMVRK